MSEARRKILADILRERRRGRGRPGTTRRGCSLPRPTVYPSRARRLLGAMLVLTAHSSSWLQDWGGSSPTHTWRWLRWGCQDYPTSLPACPLRNLLKRSTNPGKDVFKFQANAELVIAGARALGARARAIGQGIPTARSCKHRMPWL